MANPHLKVAPRTAKICRNSKSPYLRFIEVCERLDNSGWKEKVKKTANKPKSHDNHPDSLDIGSLSPNLMAQLRMGCEQWIKDYMRDGKGEQKKLFDCVKALAKETHDMRAATKYFSRVK